MIARKLTAKREISLHLMLIPAILLVLLFSYGPMLGIVIAFQDFIPARGFLHSEWIGFDNFTYMMKLPDIYQILWNTIFISSMKIVAGLVLPILLALLLNEVVIERFKRTIQVLIYMPYFLSWIILGGIIVELLSKDGMVNQLLGSFHIDPIIFLGNNSTFPYVLVTTDLWKNVGFGTVIYLAALTGVDPTLYEAAGIDGANRWKQTLHITLPAMLPIIVLVTTLSLGDILNAGFEQVLTLYNPAVYKSGDIIDTYVYRMGLIGGQFSFATAVGVFKSVVSFVLVSATYFLAYRLANYRIF